MAGSDVINVLMLDVLRPDLEAWLASRNLMLGRLPDDAVEANSLPTYVVTPIEM